MSVLSETEIQEPSPERKKCNAGGEVPAKPVRCGDLMNILSSNAVVGYGVDAQAAEQSALDACLSCLLQAQEKPDAPAQGVDCGECDVFWPGQTYRRRKCKRILKLVGRNPCRALSVPFAVVQQLIIQLGGKPLKVALGDIPGALEFYVAAGALSGRNKIKVICDCPMF